MGKSENIAAQERFRDAINNRNLDDLRNLIAPDCVDHDPSPRHGQGPDAFIAFFNEMIAAFPDLAVEIEYMVADDDNVALAYAFTGTHRGDFLGVPPTGRRMRVRGLQIARFNPDARLVERWGSFDQLGVLVQLGAV